MPATAGAPPDLMRESAAVARSCAASSRRARNARTRSSTASIRSKHDAVISTLDASPARGIAPSSVALRSQSAFTSFDLDDARNLEPVVLDLRRVRQDLLERETRGELVGAKHVRARDRVRRWRHVLRRHLAHLRRVVEDHGELFAEAFLLLVGELEAREPGDVIDVDLDRHGRKSSRVLSVAVPEEAFGHLGRETSEPALAESPQQLLPTGVVTEGGSQDR